MSGKRLIVLAVFAVVLVVAGVAGWFTANAFKQGRIPIAALNTLNTDVLGQQLPDTVWQDLDGGTHQFQDWPDKILIINHWATWCPPCRAELPLLMDFQTAYADRGVQVIGISHDSLELARPFVDDMGINYPQLLAGASQGLQWANSLGAHGGLPFTVVFDQSGKLTYTKLGLLSQADLNQAVSALLD